MKGHLTRHPESDLLGEAVYAALNFALSGFNPELTFESSVVNRRVRCGDAFAQQNGRWFMTTDYLPGDVNIKAVGVDAEFIFVETSPLDVGEVTAVIRKHMLPVTWDRRRRMILDSSTRRMIGRIEDQNDLKVELPKELSGRCLWTIPWAKLEESRRREAIRLIDLVYTAGAYDQPTDDEAEEAAAPTAQTQRLRLELGLQQRLQLEQRPMLALTQQMRIAGIQTTRMELTQILGLQQSILRMGPAQLETFANRDLTPEGQARTLQIFLFVLAGQVKRAMADTHPDMTWKQARRMARQLVEKDARRRSGS